MNDWYHFSIMIILLEEKVIFLFSQVHQEAQGVRNSLCFGVLSGLTCCIYLVETRQILPMRQKCCMSHTGHQAQAFPRCSPHMPTALVSESQTGDLIGENLPLW